MSIGIIIAIVLFLQLVKVCKNANNEPTEKFESLIVKKMLALDEYYRFENKIIEIYYKMTKDLFKAILAEKASFHQDIVAVLQNEYISILMGLGCIETPNYRVLERAITGNRTRYEGFLKRKASIDKIVKGILGDSTFYVKVNPMAIENFDRNYITWKRLQAEFEQRPVWSGVVGDLIAEFTLSKD